MMKLALAFILLLALQAQAAELIQTGETVRGSGMGGVRVFGSDAGAFISNPAHLAYLSGVNVDLMNLGLGLNGTQAYQDFQNVDTSNISNLYGKHLWAGVEGHAALAFPFFAVGYYNKGHLDFELHNPGYPTADATFFNDQGFILAGAVPLGPQGSFGFSAKRIDRLGGAKEIGPDVVSDPNFDAALILDQFQNRGIGYGIDAGLMYRVNGPFSPTVSLAWQDIGCTSFVKTGGTTKPSRIDDNVTLGMTFEQKLPVIGLAGGIEYRHINAKNEQLGKKVHMGAELNFLNFDFRAGFAQGYTSYGLGIDLFLLQLDLGSYKVERGAYPGQTPDARIQVGLSMGFNFDADFNLSSLGGKGQRLKQRR